MMGAIASRAAIRLSPSTRAPGDGACTVVAYMASDTSLDMDGAQGQFIG
jgi:hypothetical protein